eukprot:COSAG01_NODE_18533_length_1069_cov_10.684536_1_plen_77_part_10
MVSGLQVGGALVAGMYDLEFNQTGYMLVCALAQHVQHAFGVYVSVCTCVCYLNRAPLRRYWSMMSRPLYILYWCLGC